MLPREPLSEGGGVRGFTETARLPQVGYKFGRWMDLVLMQKFL